MIQQLLASFGSSGPVIPHVADANARLSIDPDPKAVVAGAGTSSVNGTYTPRGVTNGRTYYNLIGQHDSDQFYVIKWATDRWVMTDSLGTALYRYIGDVANPWDVPAWVIPGGGGSAPAPTVTNGGKVAGYRVIQDDGPTLYEFLGDGADADAGAWVSGAGSEDANGAYLSTLDGGVQINGSHSITAGGDGGAWTLNSNPYYSGEVTDYPWQVATWTAVDGLEPVPTVTRDPMTSVNNWQQIP